MAYYKVSRFEATEKVPIKNSLENSLERQTVFITLISCLTGGYQTSGHWNRKTLI
jgi:hypothetical protein